MVIWKYPLERFDQVLHVPLAAKTVHVGQQDGMPTLWMMVDPKQDLRERRFVTVGTGHPIPDGVNRFHGTAVMPSGLVWHVMEADS